MPEPHRRPRRAPLALAFAIVASLCALAQVKAVTAQIATPVAGASGLPGMRADTESLGSRRPTLEALGLAGGGTTVRATDVDAFLAIGFSYLGPKGLEVSVRVDLVEGGWTEWTSLERAGESTETSAPERRFTEPLAMGQPARGYEVVVPAGATDVRVHLIREDATKTEPREVGPTTLSPSAAGDGIPGPDGIRSRASWGARVRNQTDGCGWGARPEGRGCVATDGVIHAVVHHTVHANDYPASAVPTILRSIQAFHMDAQGWDDIGYNFLVDRFGTIWEGRAGGADRPVVGAHTMGFNTSSVGVAIVGTFESAVPTAATLESVSTVIAWKFAQRNVDPLGSTVLVSHGGDLSPEFELVPMDNIAGHRQLGQTSCPGAQVMSRLPQIRQRVAELMPLFTGELTGMDRFSGQMRLTGFALRRDTSAPVNVTLNVDGAGVATVTANQARADVATRFGSLGGNHGFEFVVPVSLAAQTACVFETSSGTLLGCREINPVTPPFGDFSSAIARASPPSIDVGGWAADPDTTEATPVHIYVDGTLTGLFTSVPRPDVAAAFPGYGITRGFVATVPTTLGAHSVCAYAINVPAGGHTLLGCRAVTVGRTDRFGATGNIDVAEPRPGGIFLAGWAADGDTTEPIVVHAYIDGVATHIAADGDRPDVGRVFPTLGSRHGFLATLPASPGPHDVCVYAINDNLVGPHTLLGCRHIDVDARPATGSLDVVATTDGTIVTAGWAADPDSPAPIPVHVYVDGVLSGTIANLPRPDVARALPAFGPDRGFTLRVAAVSGVHQVCVYAINDNLVGPHTLLGCRRVDVDGTPPTGHLDLLAGVDLAIVASGWAADPDSTAPIPVHVYVDGVLTGTIADGSRPDVAAAVPAFGPNRGFSVQLSATAGPHQVCIYAINNNLVGPHTPLGCQTVVALLPHGTPPVGSLDVVSGTPTVTVDGWAVDPDTSDPISVRIDSGAISTTIVAGDPRPDVAAALPGAGPNHGFHTTVTAAAGTQVCVFALNDNPAAPATALGCRRV